jgi:hypothetical protein
MRTLVSGFWIVIACFLTCSCAPAKQFGAGNIGEGKALFPCSLTVETKASYSCLNEVMDACKRVRPVKDIFVNQVNGDRMEIRIIFDGITALEKEQLLHYIYQLTDARLVQISG